MQQPDAAAHSSDAVGSRSPSKSPNEASFGETPAQREAETRRRRASTRTLSDAVRVFASYATPSLLLGFAAVSTVARASMGPARLRDSYAAGLAFGYWPFQEWFLHKALLHMEPVRIGEKSWLPFFAQKHRSHHDNPSEFADVFLPSSVVAVAFPAFALAIGAATRDKRSTATFMASVSFMALIYEWTHFMTHADYRPKSSYARMIWKRHRLHHYRSEHHWYGFTVPWVDDLFGTAPPIDEVPYSPTCRTLGG